MEVYHNPNDDVDSEYSIIISKGMVVFIDICNVLMAILVVLSFVGFILGIVLCIINYVAMLKWSWFLCTLPFWVAPVGLGFLVVVRYTVLGIYMLVVDK